MVDVHFVFPSVQKFERAMKIAAPANLLKASGKAMFLIGRSDTDKIKTEQLQGGSLNIKSKGFLNAFKSKASDSREVKSLDQLQLSEYTGAKPFKIFQDGGDIAPVKSSLLTILTAAAKTAGGKRKYSQQELRAMIDSGQAKIIQIPNAGPAIVLAQTKTGKDKKGPLVVLAWLKPRVHEDKRIDFYGNFEKNSAEHERILDEAAQWAIDKTMDDEDFEED
jgi:hypothetical protein